VKTKRLRVKIIAGALALIILALSVWSFVIEPNSLVVNEVPMTLTGWPPDFNNLKIAIISDLHVGSPYINAKKLEQVVATINKTQPDLIVILGDFVIQDVVGGNFVEPEVIAASLKSLHAPLGVFAVLGNHDWYLDGLRVKRALEAVGIRVLENDVQEVRRNEQSIWLAGIGDLWTGHTEIQSTLRKIPPKQNVVVLTHNPDIFPELPAEISLTLAGHTHGGQVNIPLLGRLQVPSRFGQRYAAGVIEEAGKHLFVTTGIGTSLIPVRFRVPPEIAILKINAAKD
jgi:predicted MPP superfamily phosphohydrolase